MLTYNFIYNKKVYPQEGKPFCFDLTWEKFIN